MSLPALHSPLPISPHRSVSSWLCSTAYCLLQFAVVTPSCPLFIILPHLAFLSFNVSHLHIVLLLLNHLWSLCLPDHPARYSVPLMFLSVHLAFNHLSYQGSPLLLQVPLLFQSVIPLRSSSSPLLLYWFSDTHHSELLSLSHSHRQSPYSFVSKRHTAYFSWIVDRCFPRHFVLASSFSIIQAHLFLFCHLLYPSIWSVR